MDPRKDQDMGVTHDAAEWYSRLQSDRSLTCRAAFASWLKQSPRHIHEFLMISAVAAELAAADPERRIDVQALLAEGSRNLVQLHPDDARSIPTPSQGNAIAWRRVSAFAAAAAVAAAVAVGLWVHPWTAPLRTYATATGEQRTVKLPDGSLVYLAAQSSVEVNFTDTSRRVRLLSGEALFFVQPNPSRPFWVVTQRALVRDVGTQFDVLANADRVRVSVLEGKVQVFVPSAATTNRSATAATDSGRGLVAPGGSGGRFTVAPAVADSSAAPVEITAGEQATSTREGLVVRTVAHIDEAAAWLQRRFVFHDDTLGDIVADFNRYNNTPVLHVAGAAARRRYTGTLSADDPRSLVALLAADNNLILTTDGGVVTIREKTPD